MCVTVKIKPSAGLGVADCLVDVSLCRNPCGPTPSVTQGAAELRDGAALTFPLPAPPPHVIQAQGSGSGGSPWHENVA